MSVYRLQYLLVWPVMSSVILSLGCWLPAVSAQDGLSLRRALADPSRAVTDFARDDIRRPVEVLEFLGIRSGMTVMDVYAAGGYYTFILSKALGPEGAVLAQKTERGLRFKEDRQEITQGEALKSKILEGNLTNVTQLIGNVTTLDLSEGSLDAALLMLSLHDSYNSSPERALELLRRLYSYLAPGGILGISDHIGLPENNNRDLHRMPVQQAIELAEQAGFMVQQSRLLANPEDDHSRSVFDPRLARHTDRFLLKLTKPDSDSAAVFAPDQVNLLLSGDNHVNSRKRILRYYEATKTRSGYSR